MHKLLKVRTCAIGLLVAGLAIIATYSSFAQAGAQAANQHAMLSAGEIKWGPAPPGLPNGSQAAVLDGDPSKPGPFTLRAKMPDGYKVPPHWHPTDEAIAVLSGTLMVGMGDKMNEASMRGLSAGGFAKMPQRTNHYVITKGETVIQVNGMGPFEITYVNPADDPRKSTSQ